MTSGAWSGRRALAGAVVGGSALVVLALAACGGPAGPAGSPGLAGPVNGVSAGTAGPSISAEATSAGVPSPGGGASDPTASRAAVTPAGPGVTPATTTPEGAPAGPVAKRSASRQDDPFSAAALSYLAARAGTVLAAVYDARTGQSWRLGDGPAQDEASVVKLNILETLLSESDGAGLSAGNQALAQQMIENSDNKAATVLWYAAGGQPGLAAYNAAAGLTSTTPSTCVDCLGFPWPGWGLTTTVPADQITLLKQLIRPNPQLTAGEQSYALSLLENVTPDQAWGISGGVPAGVTVALKNGWLPLNLSDTDWQVNSEGWVCGDGRDYLIAVLTTGNPDEQYGIDTISRLSSMIWTALR